MTGDTPEERASLQQLRHDLATLEEWQWYIEDVAQTPGNFPAQAFYDKNIEPMVSSISATLATLTERENNKYVRDKSDTLGRVLSNFQLYFTEDQLHLQAFMENATVSSEVEFRESMEKTLRAMELIKSHADSSGADPQFASLVLDVNGYTRLVNEVFAARTQKNWNVSSYLLSTEAVPRARAVSQNLERILAGRLETMGRDVERVHVIGNVTVIALVVLLLVMVVIAYALSRRGTQRIMQPVSSLVETSNALARGRLGQPLEVSSHDEIGRLTESVNELTQNFRQTVEQANAVAAGDYETEVVIQSEEDELGLALRTMTENLASADRENQRSDWFKTGHTELADQMRGSLEIPVLGQNVLSFMARYLDAKTGALYVGETDKELHLVSSYALTRRKRDTSRVQVGEGLVGQAALEGKPIVLTEVADDYMTVESAVGATTPCNVLVAPLVMDGLVKGVLELGSLVPFSDRQLEFVDQVAEYIAIAIGSGQDQERLQLLLSESTRQQTELSKANEEMEEQTQQLRSSEEQLQAQSEELQQTNEELEEKTQYLERQKHSLEQKRSEIEAARSDLQRKAEDLESANRYKSEFLANMSHELRTPLNSLLILAKDLADNEAGNLTEEQVEAARIINNGGHELLHLINDVLDLSKVEAGHMEVNRESIALAGLARDLEAQFAAMASGKNLRLAVEAHREGPPEFNCDERLLRQVLKNLISNAIKFTETGAVEVLLGEPSSRGLGFSVGDTGMGIPTGKLEAIFEAFQQADGSTSREYGGTGLGLSISRKLADLMGGDLMVQSTENEGSRFTLTLPFASAGQERPTKPVSAAPDPTPADETPRAPIPSEAAPVASFLPDDRDYIQPGDRVLLIVEDDAGFAGVLLGLARKAGYKVLAAGDGRSALFLARHFLPSGIVLDLGLPDVDGLQVLSALKEDLSTRHIPVHVVSGREDSRLPLEKGAVGFIRKPVDATVIEQVLGSFDRLHEKDTQRLLLVEDSEADRIVLTGLIDSGNVEIVEAETAGAALNALAGEERFDCVILDLNLPDMSGIDLLEQATSDRRIELPPVIVYTAQDLSQEERTAIERYAQGTVIKGADTPEQLLDEVSLFLHSVTSELPAESQEIIRLFHQSDEVLKDKTVLLVDDDLRNTFALSKVLRSHGMRVVMADNGELALEQLQLTPEIALVIMDVMMPVMDGYEASRRIRGREGAPASPLSLSPLKQCWKTAANVSRRAPTTISPSRSTPIGCSP